MRCLLAMFGSNRFVSLQVPLDPSHFEMKMQKSIPDNAEVYYVNLNLNFQLFEVFLSNRLQYVCIN